MFFLADPGVAVNQRVIRVALEGDMASAAAAASISFASFRPLRPPVMLASGSLGGCLVVRALVSDAVDVVIEESSGTTFRSYVILSVGW